MAFFAASDTDLRQLNLTLRASSRISPDGNRVFVVVDGLTVAVVSRDTDRLWRHDVIANGGTTRWPEWRGAFDAAIRCLARVQTSGVSCRHCGDPAIDTGDGWHFVHRDGPSGNSKYCAVDNPDSPAMRGPSDVTLLLTV